MNEKIILSRSAYLDELERHRVANDLIKIVTGVRRCGKSTLLKIFSEKLRSEGVKDEQIITINMEDFANRSFLDGAKLHQHVEARILKNKINYVILDEVQLVSNFSEVINSLRLKENIDLYVTGSNSSLLSARLPKILGGRYIQIHMLPLSFKEYFDSFNNPDKSSIDYIFQQYIEFGSFPETLTYRTNMDKEGMYEYLSHIYESIIMRDVMQNDDVKELPQLTRVVNFLFSNIGSETSINNMLGVINNEFKLKPTDKNLYAPILEKYLQALLDSFIFYKAEKQYLNGKELLRTNAKYYAVDVALRYHLLGGTTEKDAGHLLENIVYLELLRRGYKIKIGKTGTKEIDFVAQKPGGKIEYYQVSMTVIDEKTLERELEPLQVIKDNHPKFLLTRDHDHNNYRGIQHINVLEWLLNGKHPAR
ncbi:MAG: ATP-binding protein [Treponema sp.]|nr:ATP-binding protein [Treponema sp.]